MKVSEHLASMHKAAHGHHAQMIAAHEMALKKAQDMEDGAHYVKFHKTAIASHQQMADYHEAAMEECTKAAAASDLAKQQQLVPDRISNLVPDYPSVRAVPRTGQRLIEKSEVPTELDFVVEAIQD